MKKQELEGARPETPPEVMIHVDNKVWVYRDREGRLLEMYHAREIDPSMRPAWYMTYVNVLMLAAASNENPNVAVPGIGVIRRESYLGKVGHQMVLEIPKEEQ